MTVNLADNLIETARRRPDAVAMRLDAIQLSYAELDRASAHLAGWLQAKGIRPGDRVGVMMPNLPDFAVLYYGILRAGAIVVPLNVLFKKGEVAYHLGDPGARLLFVFEMFAAEGEAGAAEAGAECCVLGLGGLGELIAGAPSVEGAAPLQPDDTAVLLYTSGTTGRPKGAELTHANLIRNTEVMNRLFQTRETDVILGILPLFHSFGQTCVLNVGMAAGACVTLVPRFEPAKVLEVIERDRVTVVEGVPTMYIGLLNHPDRASRDLSSVRLCGSGGASMPVEVLHAVEEGFGCPVVEGYGLSETSPVASFNRPDRERKAGSIGIPLEGVEMKVVDVEGRDLPPGEVGEILIRGHNVMKGYWNRPEATAEAISADGWFRSGDLARMDEDGYFFIVDRKKDMIIRGGFNVYPREIEEVLYQHPAVREAAVIGLPHPELGEEVGAAVVAAPEASVTPEELREFVRERVAAYKYPRQVWLVAELPKTATGKILKRQIARPEALRAES